MGQVKSHDTYEVASTGAAIGILRDVEKAVAEYIPGVYGSRHHALQAAIDAVVELAAYAESALAYVDAAADAERQRHRANGAPKSQVIAQTVADNLRNALAALSTNEGGR